MKTFNQHLKNNVSINEEINDICAEDYILIHFSDSDFSSCFHELLELSEDIIFNCTKKQLALVISSLFIGVYMIYQNGYSKFKNLSEIETFKNENSYSDFSELNIYFDDEVIEYMKREKESKYINNGEYIIIDGNCKKISNTDFVKKYIK